MSSPVLPKNKHPRSSPHLMFPRALVQIYISHAATVATRTQATNTHTVVHTHRTPKEHKEDLKHRPDGLESRGQGMHLLVLVSLLSMFSLTVVCAEMSKARTHCINSLSACMLGQYSHHRTVASLCHKSLSIIYCWVVLRLCVSLLPPFAVMSSDTMRECDPLTLMRYPTSSTPCYSPLPSLSPKYISINPSPLLPSWAWTKPLSQPHLQTILIQPVFLCSITASVWILGEIQILPVLHQCQRGFRHLDLKAVTAFTRM